VRTLLAVHAHPDDETLTTGGTLARYSAAGVRTIVVTCTLGDLGEVPPSLRAREPDVAALRDRELDAAIRTLGVARVVKLGYGDSGMAGEPANERSGSFARADLQTAAARIVELFEAERPSVLLAYDETGGYGHPDHVKAHQVALAAYHTAPSRIRPARLFFVRFPRTWAARFVESLRAAGIDAPPSAAAGADAGPDVTQIGVPDEVVTARVDVSGFIGLKRAALECHASQMPPEHFLMRMPPALASQLWHDEYYSLETAIQHDTNVADDLFAGLDD